MECIALTGISNHVLRDLTNRVLRTIEIRSPHNFVSILHAEVGASVFLSSVSPDDITAGTTGIVARVQRRDISIQRMVQSNDFFFEEREMMMARVQLVATGAGRVRRIVRSEIGFAMVVSVDEKPAYAAR